ncbi:MAG: polyprenyl diphosphate synthase, partial [Desulfobacterales bacterium]
IRFLTLYAFSTENWERPKTEITALMTLLKKFLNDEKQELLENNIRLTSIGQTDRLPANVQDALNEAKSATAANDGMWLNLALSYGSRAEIVAAVQKIAVQVANGEINAASISPELISQHLYTADMPDPELLIRTSGEFRISNFLLWQIAYTEIHVTQTLWPDLTRDELVQILKDYQQRERRFGRVSG